MKLIRRAIKIMSVLLILFDLVLVWEMYRYGPPMVMSGAHEVRPGEAAFSVSRVPISIQDWAMLLALLGAHALLIYLLWRFRRNAVSE